jgi:hypothetical protein
MRAMTRRRAKSVPLLLLARRHARATRASSHAPPPLARAAVSSARCFAALFSYNRRASRLSVGTTQPRHQSCPPLRVAGRSRAGASSGGRTRRCARLRLLPRQRACSSRKRSTCRCQHDARRTGVSPRGGLNAGGRRRRALAAATRVHRRRRASTRCSRKGAAACTTEGTRGPEAFCTRAHGQSSQTNLVRCRAASHACTREVHARAHAALGADARARAPCCGPQPTAKTQRKRG